MSYLLLALASFAAFSLACTRHIAPPENAIEQPEKLRAAIEARLSQVQGARFKEVVLDYFGDGQRVKVRQLILVKRPDKLRVQTRVPGTDAIMSLLVTDGESFAMHKRDTNEYFTGAPTPENISRLLPIDLSARDVVRVMLGGAPWDRFERSDAPATLSWNTETGRYVYGKPTPSGGVLQMQVRPTDYAVVAVTEKNASGETTYRYTTEDWKRVGKGGKIALPEYRRFVWPARDLDFSLDVGETEIDPGLADGLFQLPPPAGSTIIPLGGGGAGMPPR
jgi:outer membrane lipoprotein-sorting protein